MTTAASIKASAFVSAAEDVLRLVEVGRMGRGDLEDRLERADLPWLEKQIAPSEWVPIETYRRVVEVLVELDAGGDMPRYLHERGERAAERMHKAGLYKPFLATADPWGTKLGKIAVASSGLLYNFMRWTFTPEGSQGGVKLTVDDAAAFPEVSRFTTQGFLEYTARAVSGLEPRVRSTRQRPELVVYHGTL